MDRREFVSGGFAAAIVATTPWWKFWTVPQGYVELVDSYHTYRFQRSHAGRVFSGRLNKSDRWHVATAGEGQSATAALREVHEKLYRDLDGEPGPWDAAPDPDDYGEVSFRAGMLVGMWDAKFRKR